MSTIEEFLASPSSTFEDVTDTILAPGGPKSKEVENVQVVTPDGESGAEVVELPADDPDGVSADVESFVGDEEADAEEEVTAADSAADVVEPVGTVRDDVVPLTSDAAVESAAAPVDVEDDVPSPRRRRRRH